MTKKLQTFIFATFYILLTIFSYASKAAEIKAFVAYSMNNAQTWVEKAIADNEDFRKTSPDLFYLGGITRPWAVIFDPQNNDWILLGERDPEFGYWPNSCKFIR